MCVSHSGVCWQFFHFMKSLTQRGGLCIILETLFVNSHAYMSHAGGCVTGKLVENWVSCVWNCVTEKMEVCCVIKFLPPNAKQWIHGTRSVGWIHRKQLKDSFILLCTTFWLTLVFFFHDTASYTTDRVLHQFLCYTLAHMWHVCTQNISQ